MTYGAVLALAAGTSGAALLAAGRDSAEAGAVPAAVPAAIPIEGTGGIAAIAMAVQADRREVYPGDAVTLFVTVANTGTTPITGIALASSVNRLATGKPDPAACERRAIGDLRPGRSVRIACVADAPATVFSVESTVSGRTSTGSVSDSTTIVAGGQEAALSASITPSQARYQAGEDVEFRVRIRNSGAVQLRRISTLNSMFPGCGKGDLGSLDAGEERDYTCIGTAGLDDAATAVVASGEAPGLPPARAVSAFATVDVVHPALAITSETAGGQTSVTVANAGDTAVTGLRTTAPSAAQCARPSLGSLAPGMVTTYRCPAGSGVLAAAATTAGEPVTAATTIHPRPAGFTVLQRVSAGSAQPGSPVTFTVTVRNTGRVALRRGWLRDPVFPACDGQQSGSLAPGRRIRLSCTVPAPLADVRHLAIAVAEPASGDPVAVVGSALTLDVVSPALAVTLRVEPPEPFPGDPVRWLLTVANAGDVTVRSVTARSELRSCGARPGTMRPGAAPGRYLCTVPAGDSTTTNAVTVTGRLPSGERVTEIATATATIRMASGLGSHTHPSS